MFDIGFWEILVIAVVILIVLGPERLPEVAKQAAFFVRKARQGMFRLRNEMKSELGGTPFDGLQDAKREMTNLTNDMKQFGRDLANSHEESLNGESGSDAGERTSSIRTPDDEPYPWEQEAKAEFAAAQAAKKKKVTKKKASKKAAKKTAKKAAKKTSKKVAKKAAKKASSKKKATKKTTS
jgi:Tat protein translocase TatB subunit